MVVLDNTLLSLLFHERAKPPQDPTTGKRLAHVKERLDLLMETWQLDAERILIPAPALTEFLIIADRDGDKYLAEITSSRLFEVADFDMKAAIELAALNLDIMTGRDKREAKRGSGQATWAKVTFDRQIVGIAKSNQAHTSIYSDDGGVERFAKRCGIAVVRTWELPVRPQPSLFLEDEDSILEADVSLDEPPADKD